MGNKKDKDQLLLFEYPEDDLEDLLTMSERLRSLKELARAQQKLNDSRHITALFCYDIEMDGLRKELVRILEQKGCYRIQKSVFLGRLKRDRFKNLWREIRGFRDICSPQDSIVAIPLTEVSISNIKMIGDTLDLDLILDRKSVLVI